jgi:hypothetical protein
VRNARVTEVDECKVQRIAPTGRARVLGWVLEIRSSRSTVSTDQLRVSRLFHLPPIKHVISVRSYLVNPEGELILRSASHLDAFSGYPERT